MENFKFDKIQSLENYIENLSIEFSNSCDKMFLFAISSITKIEFKIFKKIEDGKIIFYEEIEKEEEFLKIQTNKKRNLIKINQKIFRPSFEEFEIDFVLGRINQKSLPQFTRKLLDLIEISDENQKFSNEM